MEKNPLKMACSFPCGRIMRNGHTHNPLTLRNAFVSAQLHTPCNPQSVQLECCNISQHSFLLTLLAAAVFTTMMAFPWMLECCNNISALLSFDSFGCCSIRCKHGFPMDVGGLQQHLSALFWLLWLLQYLLQRLALPWMLEHCNIICQHAFLLTLLAASAFAASMAFLWMLECFNNISQHSFLLTPLAAAVFATSMAFLWMFGAVGQLIVILTVFHRHVNQRADWCTCSIPIQTLFDPNPEGGAVAVAFTPDARYLATLSAGSTQVGQCFEHCSRPGSCQM